MLSEFQFPMPYKSLSLVRATGRYIPFDADSGNLYEERVSHDDAPAPYETKTAAVFPPYLLALQGLQGLLHTDCSGGCVS